MGSDALLDRLESHDRCSGAFAVGRARDWEWAPTLALGNCCASRYVERAETADRAALREFLEVYDGV